MKKIKINLIGYLNNLQFMEDRGIAFEVNDDAPTRTIGVYVKKIDTRFWCRLSEFTAMCNSKQKIDESIYHGKTLKLVKAYNIIIEKHVPFANFRKILNGMYAIAETHKTRKTRKTGSCEILEEF